VSFTGSAEAPGGIINRTAAASMIKDTFFIIPPFYASMFIAKTPADCSQSRSLTIT
jgi:hypothetical protein